MSRLRPAVNTSRSTGMRTTDLWDLAKAVTATNYARLVHPDNTTTDPLPLHDAIVTGQAYLVIPRPELLVLDVDLPSDPTRTADLLTHLDHLTTTAHHAGVPTWTVPSGRPGHSHTYLVTGTGPARARLAHWATSVGMDVRTHGIRPPGAPHRNGTTRAWDPTWAPQDVTSLLTAPANPTATSTLAAELCPVQLPQRLRAALRHGHDHAGYDSPSHARMALAIAVRARGGPLSLLRALLNEPTSPLGATFRRRASRWQEQELTRLWTKAGTWLTTSHPHTPTADLDDLTSALGDTAWTGVAGSNDLAVMEELIRRARNVPTTTVGVALGDLAVGAGVSRDTARASLRRLTHTGWVHVAAEHTARTTRMYALTIPQGLTRTGQARQVPERDDLGDLGTDITRRGGLGKVTMRVARTIATHGTISTPQLSETLQMNPPAVRHHLRKLHRAGVITGDRTGWTLTEHVGQVLTDLTEKAGTGGTRERQAQQVLARRHERASAREHARTRRQLWAGGGVSSSHRPG